MKNNNLIPQTCEVQYLKENIKLPSVEEIKKNGLSDELKEQLLNPNAKFDGDIVAFPLSETDKKISKGLGYAGAIGTGLLTLVCPPAGLAVAATCAGTALAAEAVNNFSSDENVKEGSEIVSTIFGTAATGNAVASGYSSGCKMPNHSHK